MGEFVRRLLPAVLAGLGQAGCLSSEGGASPSVGSVGTGPSEGPGEPRGCRTQGTVGERCWVGERCLL